MPDPTREGVAASGQEVEGEVPASWYLDLKVERDALLADAMVLMDQTASEEVQMEARRRIIERHGRRTNV